MAYDFDKIAVNYDRLNHLMTAGMDRRWRRRAAKEATALCGRVTKESRPQNAVASLTLDVACGTGDMTVELMQQGCSVTGIDLSEEMLAVAKRKAPAANYMVANAEQLPFADASFDIVSCAFGIRNFIHLGQGLGEMARVLKPGGKLVILELSTPDNPLVRPFYNIYSRRIIPWLGARIAGNREAYTYLPASIERFPKGKAMLQKLESVGLTAKQKKIFFGVCRMYKAVKTTT